MGAVMKNDVNDINADNILRLNNITKMFSGTLALHKVNITINKGEIHGIIGKNGAGKSTLVNIIAGLLEPSEGEIILNGKTWHGLSRSKARDEKIAIVPQEPQVVLDYTVAENLFMPDYILSNKLKTVNFNAMYDKARDIVKQAGFSVNVEAKAGDLTVSERQLLLVIKAFYFENARIVILDEASASLSQKDEKLFCDIITKSRDDGNTVIFISHHVDEILRLCDRVTVIRDGTTIGTYHCRDLDKQKISNLIVGEDYSVTGPVESTSQNKQLGGIVLSVNSLTKAGVFQNIKFNLRKGEILGFAGLRGSGRTEIFKCIAGIDSFDEGEIKTHSFKGRFKDPAQAQKHGVVYLPEDRETEGLISVLSVRENLVLTSLRKITKSGLVRKKLESKQVLSLINMLDVKTASPEQEISQLSGGNKQKVVVARIVGGEPTVFILDEPTRGIDISAKVTILNIIKEQLSKNGGVIITSPGIEELVQICDRILVIYEGKIIKEFLKESFSERNIYFAIQGGDVGGSNHDKPICSKEEGI